jgi:cobalamin synthase
MHNIKKIYLFAVSLISLVIMVIAGIILINLGIKTWILTKADQTYYSTPCMTTKPAQSESVPVGCTAEEAAAQKKQDQDNRTAQKQSDAAQALAMLIVASPVFYFHWRLARKEA